MRTLVLVAALALSACNKKPEKPKVPVGAPVEGMPGFMKSPYAPAAGYIDVRGFKSGAEVKDPYTGKMIQVP